ncbi:hypothetical protein C5S39_12070 [Candidatus Methanophagaceae archaeon]|jgi:hypothetical protein|nr:hypothetical protein C5S39_12070 [Methanophagales archaeon]
MSVASIYQNTVIFICTWRYKGIGVNKEGRKDNICYGHSV